MPRINLLPWREARAQAQAPGIPRRRSSAALGRAPALVDAARAAGRCSAAIEQPERAQPVSEGRDRRARQADRARSTGSRARSERLLARMEVIETAAAQPSRGRARVRRARARAARGRLPDVRSSRPARRSSCSGVAQSSTRVSAFMRNIDASEWLADPALRHRRDQGHDAGTRRASSRCSPTQRSQVPVEGDDAASAEGGRANGARSMSFVDQLRNLDSERPRPLAVAVPRSARSADLFVRRRRRGVLLVRRGSRRSPSCSSARAKETELLDARSKTKANARPRTSRPTGPSSPRWSVASARCCASCPSKTEVPNLLVDISQTGLGAGLEEKLFQPTRRDQQGLLRRAADQDPAHRQLPRDGRVRERHRGAAAHRDAARHRDHAGCGKDARLPMSCRST